MLIIIVRNVFVCVYLFRSVWQLVEDLPACGRNTIAGSDLRHWICKCSTRSRDAFWILAIEVFPNLVVQNVFFRENVQRTHRFCYGFFISWHLLFFLLVITVSSIKEHQDSSARGEGQIVTLRRLDRRIQSLVRVIIVIIINETGSGGFPVFAVSHEYSQVSQEPLNTHSSLYRLKWTLRESWSG